ncbi:MAG: MarR family winged helix-turn-helix transcriptional regulator [Bacteroidales bacterium]
MPYSFESSLGRLTQQVSKGLGKLLEYKFLQAGYAISAAQWTVISFLNSSGKATQKQIGRSMKVNKVMIKRMIDSLESEGYLKRIPANEDRRYNIVELTNKGKSLYSELVPYAEMTLNEVCKQIDNTEIQNCLGTLSKIANKIEQVENFSS